MAPARALVAACAVTMATAVDRQETTGGDRDVEDSLRATGWAAPDSLESLGIKVAIRREPQARPDQPMPGPSVGAGGASAAPGDARDGHGADFEVPLAAVSHAEFEASIQG